MRYWKQKHVKGEPTVGIGVAAYINGDKRRQAALKSLVASFQAQTYARWKLMIYHDGPLERGLEIGKIIDLSDHRINWVETAERRQKFGHPWRQKAIDALCSTCHWLLLTNDDNWYAPVFLEWLLAVATNKPKPGCVFAYCDCVHSHKLWKNMITQPRYKHLDLGGFLVHSGIAKRVPFDKFEFNGDGDWINRLVKEAGQRVVKVSATLYVHN